jgi:hypothetical protein
MHDSSVIDLASERRCRRERPRRSNLREHALDKCEEAFVLRDWDGFAYWQAVFQRERKRSEPPATDLLRI